MRVMSTLTTESVTGDTVHLRTTGKLDYLAGFASGAFNDLSKLVRLFHARRTVPPCRGRLGAPRSLGREAPNVPTRATGVS